MSTIIDRINLGPTYWIFDTIPDKPLIFGVQSGDLVNVGGLIYIMNDEHQLVFFSASSTDVSGYGVGPFGVVSWDVATAPSGAYTVLNHGVKVPNIATIGWGKEINETFFTPLNTMMDRLTALGV